MKTKKRVFQKQMFRSNMLESEMLFYFQETGLCYQQEPLTYTVILQNTAIYCIEKNVELL